MMMMMMMMILIINQGITKSSHIGLCIHTSEITDVKVQNTFTCDITLYAAHIVNKKQLQHYRGYPRKMVCFWYITVKTMHI